MHVYEVLLEFVKSLKYEGPLNLHYNTEELKSKEGQFTALLQLDRDESSVKYIMLLNDTYYVFVDLYNHKQALNFFRKCQSLSTSNGLDYNITINFKFALTDQSCIEREYDFWFEQLEAIGTCKVTGYPLTNNVPLKLQFTVTLAI